MEPKYVAVLAVALVACVTDLRSRRIPNVLTFGAATAGLCSMSLRRWAKVLRPRCSGGCLAWLSSSSRLRSAVSAAAT